ncbi:jupiter microtubule associated homolog 1-like [Coccinella septempunctata]|uniref:jupiter microtubule associated homolog 1-like n=1 Tax=Coccinella septempunctata TaxID=41139 RepID=UPI001D070925|nr:jupiter microtubule associated homolog 1-like [Coccinella septempunctata]
MTSTSFNVGVDVEAKSSSRVLRPPGGGHTDIFGIKEPIVPEIRREDNKRNASSILEGTNNEIVQSAKNQVAKTEEKPAQECCLKENNKESPAKQEDEQPAQRRPRVPPGGFSSGLW